ncbi:MAG: D-glycero-beta-D-manno-heptose 1-phosphate adenylyltransferase [Halobacteriovoraceae bacterium]|nr:D-glycero-beta-D-manno-heptose 1-phosphate adenylyltransferase [Halobacteriovoraceae bacterium]|tara:strand:- start:29 stop:481 length:453 start_codon:yes stop_codon:yes gene_type:complete
MSSPELEKFLNENKDKTIVFTNGCFDILHRGHVAYLNEARSLGDALIVGLNSDASVKRLKGESRPINSELDRKFVLENLKAVSFVEIFEEDTPYNLIQKVSPQCLVKGGDWKPEQIVGSDLVLASGGRVLSLNFVDGYSTTKIIEKSGNS